MQGMLCLYLIWRNSNNLANHQKNYDNLNGNTSFCFNYNLSKFIGRIMRAVSENIPCDRLGNELLCNYQHRSGAPKIKIQNGADGYAHCGAILCHGARLV